MSDTRKQQAGIRKQIKLPNREAFKIAGRSIRIRFWRSMITAAGIVLAIAFLTYVMTSATITRAMLDSQGETYRPSPQELANHLWLISISLLVCVVGICNAMLMSVTERYREIGTMKCLGALDWFVVKLFLIEAGFQGLIGSFAGVLLGILGAVCVSMGEFGVQQVAHGLPWGSLFFYCLIAVSVGCVLSVVGAIYPARRAGKMPPADAMRTEF